MSRITSSSDWVNQTIGSSNPDSYGGIIWEYVWIFSMLFPGCQKVWHCKNVFFSLFFLFNKLSYFITVDLKKYCEDSMESSHIYHIHFLLLLVFYVSMIHIIINGATLVIIIN